MGSAAQKIPTGYRQTEIGMIPADWDVKKLGNIGECLIGLTYKPSDVSHEGSLVLRSSNIQNNKLVFDDNVYVDVEVPEKIKVKKDDILICVRNGSRSLIGKNVLLDSRVEGQTFGAFMAIFRTPYSQFVFRQFQSNNIQQQINENIGATINQITNKNLNSFRIAFPSKEEERSAIGNALSDVATLIEKLEKLIEKKKNIKHGAMQELLTGKRRLPGFSGRWEKKKFGELGAFYKGRGISSKDLVQDGLPCIMYGDIYVKFGIKFSKPDYRIAEATAAKSSRARTGDLFFTSSGETAEEIGKCAVYLGREDIYIGGDIIAMTPSQDTDSLFLAYMQNSTALLSQKANLGQGHTVVHIYTEHIKSLTLTLPPTKDEQTAIATVLSDMDTEIEELESQLIKYQNLKQGMMQVLLTGKIRLV